MDQEWVPLAQAAQATCASLDFGGCLHGAARGHSARGIEELAERLRRIGHVVDHEDARAV